MSCEKSIFRLVVPFLLIPLIIGVGTELVKTHLVWYFRIVDFLDLIVTAPFYILMLVIFHEIFVSCGNSRTLRLLLLVSSMALLYGHSMHVTANSIHTFAVEIRGYSLPSDLGQLIFFLDEDLSHIVSFISAYAVMICLWFLDYAQVLPSSTRGQIFALSFGAVYGLFHAVMFVEAGKVALYVMIAAVVCAIWVVMLVRARFSIRRLLSTGYMTCFMTSLIPATLVGFALYVAAFQGLTPPSQL